MNIVSDQTITCLHPIRPERLLIATLQSPNWPSRFQGISSAGADYGIIEAKWIPTGSLGIPLFGRFSYYHFGLLVLMLVVSTALAWCHMQWLLENKRKYVILVCASTLPLSVLIEDVTWFVTRGQPIHYDEWTMIRPGWGINVGFTWIPFWYIGVICLSLILLFFANKSTEQGYPAFLAKSSLRSITKN